MVYYSTMLIAYAAAPCRLGLLENVLFGVCRARFGFGAKLPIGPTIIPDLTARSRRIIVAIAPSESIEPLSAATPLQRKIGGHRGVVHLRLGGE